MRSKRWKTCQGPLLPVGVAATRWACLCPRCPLPSSLVLCRRSARKTTPPRATTGPVSIALLPCCLLGPRAESRRFRPQSRPGPVPAAAGPGSSSRARAIAPGAARRAATPPKIPSLPHHRMPNRNSFQVGRSDRCFYLRLPASQQCQRRSPSDSPFRFLVSLTQYLSVPTLGSVRRDPLISSAWRAIHVLSGDLAMVLVAVPLMDASGRRSRRQARSTGLTVFW